MSWPFRKRPAPKALPKSLRDELVSRYYVDAERAAHLLCMERETLFGGRRVRYVRIFDPALVAAEAGSFRDIHEITGPCLLFEGRLEKDKPSKLKDYRPGLLDTRRHTAASR